jgi:exodeoxyribonuclease VII small subunit
LTSRIRLGKLAALFLPPASAAVSKKTRIEIPDLEKSLAELEQIVARMEQGELSLDESLKQFERGIALTRNCQSALQQAEHKVEMLLRKSGATEIEDGEILPFETDENEDADQ